VDFGWFDASGNYDFPSLCVFGGAKLRNCFGGQHPPVHLIVMPYPQLLVIRNSEVDRPDWPSIASFQFPQPLVRDIEVSRNGDSENAAWKVAGRAAQTPDAIFPDQGNPRLRRKMNERRHPQVPLTHN
jgi:hypothetical protein